MKTIKVETYLPVFSGFYNSFADWIIKDEISYYEDQYGHEIDSFNFDYEAFYNDLAVQITSEVESELYDLGFIESIEFQNLISPKYYNFVNDSIDCIIELNESNISKIKEYILEYSEEFNEYLKEKYTSCPGFSSRYPNKAKYFLVDAYLQHSHKLGSILNFIAKNEGIEESYIYEGCGVTLNILETF